MADKTCKHTVVVEHDILKDHDHKHGAGCGHTALIHTDEHGHAHIDYVHDGELHHDCENGEKHGHNCPSLSDFHHAASGGELVTECNNAHVSPPCFEHIDKDSMCGTSDCDHEAVPHVREDGAVHNDYLVPGTQAIILGEGEDDIRVIELLEVHCPHKGPDGDHCDIRGYVAKAPAPPAP